ncbi:helicase-exonuclease AddAB subunit AddA [Caldibacillus lycopersici]|uniref:ATP-dependent helicase/nuclease subunit A n=1 Tax=Perspicuibacillus lycopersici TaxID=1325689 RepID=A0AAE3LS87_9BACI|nr:helicase-exonuclease AddAB subunit AddA [Perspicuibacillus lycopersici]MCU9612478.1 helicase-exonuclease AddAB subunit AddA [Perspicuibacillus lycopersici]
MTIPMKPIDVTWTDDQWRAIHAGGSDILVAAAAGSGKTAVLVERIIQKVLNEDDPINVDELLVATFTNASAAEMRHRIGVALEKEISKNPYSHHLRKQLSLLNNASISTLHSFCLNVVKKYYYLIDIDPGFRIADKTESLLLKDEAVEGLLEEEYGKPNNEAFFQVVDIFTNDRSDAGLQKLILTLYEFSRSNPDPEQWLRDLIAVYDVSMGQSIEELPFIKPLLFDIELQLTEARRLFENGYEMTKLPGGPDKRAENFLDDIAIVDQLMDAKNESFVALYERFQNYSFSKLKTCRGDEYDKDLVEQSKVIRDEGKTIIQKLKDELFSRKPESFVKDLQEMKQPVATLIDLVRAFASRFEHLKKDKGLVDFSDLEHFAIQILGKKDKRTGEIVPSETALQYRNQFKEVYIDEYQDTNMVQETILHLVKRPSEVSGNLFMVGDVKQSIYRFRLAEPNLFLAKYLRFTKDGNNSGLRIDLAQNFRSRSEVLDGTNFLFKQLMGISVGEIAYDEAAELKKGAPYPETEDYPIELAIIHKDNGEKETDGDLEDNEEETDAFSKEELEQSQMESRFVARKIQDLMDKKQQVFDPKTKSYRPLQYKDIVILLRSFTWAPQFIEEFKEAGIPSYANISTGYFNAAEVSVMVSLLKVIDNPYQDIPLAAVLRSPIFGLTEEELAQIRIHAKKVSYYEAVKSFLMLHVNTELETVIQEKLSLFANQLKAWRTMARQGALADLIWQLYRDTKFYDYVGGLPGGKQRQANLRALYDRARAYEATSFRGLFRFLRFIEKMQDRGEDLGVARSLGEQEDVVRIMTIHSSKGLEFPVVFIAGLNRKFNMMDLRKAYLFDKDYGFATNYFNPEKQITYPSLFNMAIVRKKRLELVAEEMRVLYVALTRAKEKLYLVGSTKQLDKLLDKWQKHLAINSWLLADYDRMKSDNYLDWVGPALIRHRDSDLLRLERNSENERYNLAIWNHPSKWKVLLVNEQEMAGGQLLNESEEEQFLELVKKAEPVPFESENRGKLIHQLTWKYAHQQATESRSKQSVSELKRAKEIQDFQSGEDIVRTFKKPIITRPKFLQEKKLTPAERGTAMHMVMQHIDLTKMPTKSSIQEQIAQMQAKELLTLEEAAVIDIEEILALFDTKLGIRLLKAHWMKRELPFSFSLSSSEIYSDWKESEEPVFIQGIIDCLFKDEEGLVLLDFKTDQITNRFPGGFTEAEPVLLARYKTQMELYKRAIESILKEPLHETYLFFFDGGHLLSVNE